MFEVNIEMKSFMGLFTSLDVKGGCCKRR